MKKLMLILAAALVLAPVTSFAAEDAAAPAADAAKPKKKLALKWPPHAQMAKAQAEAAKNEVPILVLVIVDPDEKSTLVKKYLLNNKIFKKFAQENFTTLLLKGKKTPKGIDLTSFKKDKEFIEKFIMDNEAKDATPDKAEYYPAAFFVSADGSKKLAHLSKYNPELGFGAWAMDLTAKLEQAGVTCNVSAELKKAIEDPQPDIKQKPAKGKKK